MIHPYVFPNDSLLRVEKVRISQWVETMDVALTDVRREQVKLLRIFRIVA